MSVAHYDAIVVGLGGVGSFALRALARAETAGKFLGLECCQQSDAGFSSLGKSRIYRRAYFEHPDYVPWIDFSIKTIREMERISGDSLLKECGTIVLEPSDTSSIDNLPPLLQSSYDSARLHSVPIEFISHKELPERFPQFQYKRRGHPHHHMAGVYEPGAGLLRPERVMKRAIEDARQASRNVEIQYETGIAGMKHLGREAGSSSSRIELQLQRNTDREKMVVTTDKLLVSMGGWTGLLIPSWGKILNPVRQIQGWVDTTHHNPALFSAGRMPAFVYASPDLPFHVYGVPADADADLHEDGSSAANWIKVGTHKYEGDNALQPMTHHPPPARSAEIRELVQAIPHVIDEQARGGKESSITRNLALVASKSCLYTVSPDHHFIIGVPEMYSTANNVFAVAGLSGHGFKMTPALGQMMADFALGGDTGTETWQAGFCSPRRFGV